MPARRDWLGFTRSADDRMIGGVCGGLAHRLGVEPGVVRLATVVLATAGGVGIILYGAARLLVPVSPPGEGVRRPPTARRAVGVALVTTGVLLLLHAMGLWFADSVTWSVGLAAAGSAVVWTRAAEDERERWRGAMQRVVGEGRLPDLRSVGRIRLSIAAVLFATGAITFIKLIEVSRGFSRILQVHTGFPITWPCPVGNIYIGLFHTIYIDDHVSADESDVTVEIS